MKTFEKTSNKVVKESNKKTFTAWVVVRHTRAGDSYEKVLIDHRGDRPDFRDIALDVAARIATEAAANYGHGSASVFKATITLAKEPEQP